MKVPPSALRSAVITLGLVLGLIASLGGTAVAATPATVTIAPAASVTDVRPAWDNDDRNDRDRRDRHDNDRNDHRGDWRNHDWRWKHWAVSPWQCRKGHGHVDWRHGRCWGGRFSGAWIRFR